MWGEIKTALNSTLGTKKFEPLDYLQERKAYEDFYNHCLTLQFGAIELDEYVNGINQNIVGTFKNRSPFVVPMNETGVINQEYLESLKLKFGASTISERTLVLPPNCVELLNVSSDWLRSVIFFPFGFKKLNSVFGRRYGSDQVPCIVEIPKTIEYISPNSFSHMDENQKVVIHKKYGEIQGHPWGHPYAETSIFYTGE